MVQIQILFLALSPNRVPISEGISTLYFMLFLQIYVKSE